MRFLSSLLFGSLALWTVVLAQDNLPTDSAPVDSNPAPAPSPSTDNPSPSPPPPAPSPPPAADNPSPSPAQPSPSPAPPPTSSNNPPCANTAACFSALGPFAYCRLTLNRAPGTAPGSCDRCTRNCTLGQYCSNGLCVAGCMVNAHCDSKNGEVCARDQGTCGCAGTSCGAGKFCDGNRKCQTGCIVDAQCNLVSRGETCQVESGQPFGKCVAKMPCDPACPKGQQCYNGECVEPRLGCNITSQANCSAMPNTVIDSPAASTFSWTYTVIMTFVPVAIVAYMF